MSPNTVRLIFKTQEYPSSMPWAVIHFVWISNALKNVLFCYSNDLVNIIRRKINVYLPLVTSGAFLFCRGRGWHRNSWAIGRSKTPDGPGNRHHTTLECLHKQIIEIKSINSYRWTKWKTIGGLSNMRNVQFGFFSGTHFNVRPIAFYAF